MSWYPGLTPLRDALAALFPNAATAGIIVDDAEVDPNLLDLDGAPLMLWQNILREAWKQGKVDALIAVAQTHYPTYGPLTAAIVHYRATPMPPLPSASEPTTANQPTSIQQTATGRNIAQAAPGGTATVNDHSRHTVFDQRGQTVHGRQTNIAGNVNTGGGLFNSGTIHTGGNLTGRDHITNPAPVDLPAELSNLLAQVTQAGQQGLLDELTVIDVESALRKALALLRKPGADQKAVLTQLTTAKNILAPIPTAVGIMNALKAVHYLLSTER
jgi:hypothetical protein